MPWGAGLAILESLPLLGFRVRVAILEPLTLYWFSL